MTPAPVRCRPSALVSTLRQGSSRSPPDEPTAFALSVQRTGRCPLSLFTQGPKGEKGRLPSQYCNQTIHVWLTCSTSPSITPRTPRTSYLTGATRASNQPKSSLISFGEEENPRPDHVITLTAS